MIKKFIKKPLEIEALQLTEKNILEVYRFIYGHESVDLRSIVSHSKWDDYEEIVKKQGGLHLKTLESNGETQVASFGDFVIKGIQGEFYPCKPEIFEKTYELVLE